LKPASIARTLAIARTETSTRATSENKMATGWAGDGAVQDQIDSTVDDAVKRARSQLPRGKSRARCEECDAKIPEARRKAVPGVRLCIACQEEHDREQQAFSGYNRRGSKDSQLR
jgi:phage/conjugal plasmid C-4 type zinc finger TraR family protein